MKGRPKTSGRFKTRAELVRRVRQFYEITDMSMAAIARNCKVSPPCVAAILDSKEWNHLRDPEDFVNVGEYGETGVMKEEPIEVEIANLHQGTCGCGWMPEAFRVHLDSRTLNELERME